MYYAAQEKKLSKNIVSREHINEQLQLRWRVIFKVTPNSDFLKHGELTNGKQELKS